MHVIGLLIENKPPTYIFLSFIENGKKFAQVREKRKGGDFIHKNSLPRERFLIITDFALSISDNSFSPHIVAHIHSLIYKVITIYGLQ